MYIPRGVLEPTRDPRRFFKLGRRLAMVPDARHQEEYRTWAAECLRLAQAEGDLALRVRFLTMAQRWLDLSEGRCEDEEFERLVEEFNDQQMRRR
jgi:hypothetical protein